MAQNQALAIAYNVKKKNKMNKGGMVENEKLHPDHEPYAEGIVQKFFSDKMGYADGGMVEEPESDMELMSESADDFLTADEDTELAMQGMPEGVNESEDGSSVMKKKRILQSIMDGLK